MLISIKNDKGVIAFDENIIDELVKDAVKPYSGSLWLAHFKGEQSGNAAVARIKSSFDRDPVKEYLWDDERGLTIRLWVVLKLGTSISQVSYEIFHYLADHIKNDLELPIDDMEIIVTGMFSKNIVPRHILCSYSDHLILNLDEDYQE